MLIVAGTIKISAEHREAAMAAAQTMAAATQQEDGCLEYQFYEHISEPSTFLVFERWESADHLAAHFETAHMAVFRSAIQGIVVARDIKRYAIASTSDL